MASGDTLIVFSPMCNEPPAANAATPDTINATSPRPVLDFDGTSDEIAIFSCVMPQHYAGTTGVTVYIWWASEATGNDVDWDVYWEKVVADGLDLDGDSWGSANSADGESEPGTIGDAAVTDVAFTDGADMESVAAGDAFRLKITRDGTNDDSAADVQLLWVEIQET